VRTMVDDITKSIIRYDYFEDLVTIEQFGNIRSDRKMITKEDMEWLDLMVRTYFMTASTTWIGWFLYG